MPSYRLVSGNTMVTGLRPLQYGFTATTEGLLSRDGFYIRLGATVSGRKDPRGYIVVLVTEEGEVAVILNCAARRFRPTTPTSGYKRVRVVQYIPEVDRAEGEAATTRRRRQLHLRRRRNQANTPRSITLGELPYGVIGWVELEVMEITHFAVVVKNLTADMRTYLDQVRGHVPLKWDRSRRFLWAGLVSREGDKKRLIWHPVSIMPPDDD